VARPITKEERQTLLENPELVMFTPQHAGLKPVVFLLVIPVATMILLAAAIFLWDSLLAWVESAPTLSCLAYVAVCAFSPWPCLYAKRRYDEAYGFDRELRDLLQQEDLTVEVVRITGVVLQRAEVYAVGDDGPFMFGIAFTRNPFIPENGSRTAILHAGKVGLAVRPDPRTSSFVRWYQGAAPDVFQGLAHQGERRGELTQKYADSALPM
jgi:hypothetical protein